ncbi:MAG: tetratricopeptide repeat protein [Acidobacteriia bacterium]|jgi:tetratricopeptide (TPR) repeat protein|nr:tetratricopeptide repeat protein [Terriglobia bacterium]
MFGPWRSQRRIGSIARLLLTLLLLYCLYLVITHAVGYWYYRQGTVADLERAIAWNPQEARYYAALARGQQAALIEADPQKILELYERAVALAPRRAESWLQLGSAYEWAGRLTEARQAYEHALRRAPNSPQVNWQVGNFYLRTGELDAAFAALQRAAVQDPQLRRAVFALAWRAADPERIRTQLLPRQTEVLLDYLDFLAATDRADEAEAIWALLLAQGEKFAPQRVFPYLDLLLRSRRTAALQLAWQRLYPAPAPAGELITNGSFEQEAWNAGLDWHIYAAEGARAAIEAGTAQQGQRALVIRFDGRQNVHFTHVFQHVPVMAEAQYRFVAWVRSEAVTTDRGPQLEIFDPDAPQRLRWTTPAMTGTHPWTELSLELRTGRQTSILVVRVTRLPSHRLDNRIAGTFWLDAVSLRSVP